MSPTYVAATYVKRGALVPVLPEFQVERSMITALWPESRQGSPNVRAFVALGGNACIIGRNVKKTEGMAQDIDTVRQGAKVIGIGAVDVRDPNSLEKAAERCARELGGIDFVM